MRIIALAAALLLAGGCSSVFGGKALQLLDDAATKGGEIRAEAYDEAGQTLDFYCANVDADMRASIRDKIAAASREGNSVTVTCAAD